MGVYQVGQAVTITETFSVAGAPSDPTSVIYTVADPTGSQTVYTFGVDVEVTNPSPGVYVLELPALSLIGTWIYTVVGTGVVTASGSGEFVVVADPLAQQDTPWPQFGPYVPWIDCGDIRGACDAEGDDELLTGIATQASQIMFELSARQFLGTRLKKVRPCENQGNACWTQGIGVDGWWGWPWAWTWDGVTWGWYDGYGCHCDCGATPQVWLSGYPVTEIVEVKIDGVAVDPTTYRLDEWRFLTRMRDPLNPDVPLFWPTCQIRALDDTEHGTWSVTYKYGIEPPLAGKAAALALACELLPGADCKLPTEAVRIVRAGLTIERLQPLAEMLRRGMTGIPAIDSFIAAYNPNGLRRRPAVWSPPNLYARPVGRGI